jgi:hypothetical protein
MLFYLSDKLYFRSNVSSENKTLLPYHPELPRYIYAEDYDPDRVVFFGTGRQFKEDTVARHAERIELAERYDELDLPPISGVEVSRPEVFWRPFGSPRVRGESELLRIFHKKPQAEGGGQ